MTTKSKLFRAAAFALLFVCGSVADAQVPLVLNYQGRIAAGGVNFSGTGQFQFALVDKAGATTYWSNDGASAGGSKPSAIVSLPVTNGLYSVLLGDASVPNMMAIPASVFTNSDVRLRVWFCDGSHPFELLSPDQRVASSGYAINSANAALAQTVAPGAIGNAQLAANITFTNADASKINGQALSSLPTGLLKITSGTGAPSVAVGGVDYVDPTKTQGELYVMSSFVPSSYSPAHWGELYISTSQDGINWNPLKGGNSVYAETSGIIRDPKIHYDALLKTFLVAHTSGGEGETGQFYIDSSPDLLNWSQLTSVSSGGSLNTSTTWNPTWFTDPNDRTVHIFFSFDPNDGPADAPAHLSIYETHPANNPPSQLSDYQTWSAPARIGNIHELSAGFNEFQVFTNPEDVSSAYYAIYVDFNYSGGIVVAKNSGSLIGGTWTQLKQLADFGREGPFLNNLGGKLIARVQSVTAFAGSASYTLDNPDGLAVNMPVVFSGVKSAANNGAFKIIAINGGSITVNNISAVTDPAPGGFVNAATYVTQGHWRFYSEANSGTGYSWTDLDSSFTPLTANLQPVSSAYPMENGFMTKVSSWMGMLGPVRPDTGTMSFQNSDNVQITGGLIGGLTVIKTTGAMEADGRLQVGAAGTSVSRLRHGSAVLNANSPSTIVPDNSITANTRIFVTLHTQIGAVGLPYYQATQRTPGASFTVTSSLPSDASSVDYLLIEP